MTRLGVVLAFASFAFGCSNTVTTSCSKDTDCDDGVYCNGSETCNLMSHKCMAGTPPSCDDGVPCTVDVCNEAAKSCSHVADSSQCGAAQHCSTAGCVSDCDTTTCNSVCGGAGYASGTCVGVAGDGGTGGGFCQCAPVTQGTLAGHALLLGHSATDSAHDHSGITVAVMGTALMTTTAADGSYSFAAVPSGAYTLTFTKPKFIPQSLSSVVVVSSATTNPPTVTLTHGRLSGALDNLAPQCSVPIMAGPLISPDEKHALFTAGIASSCGFRSFFSDFLVGMPVDASTPGAALASFGTFGVLPPQGLSNDHAVFASPWVNDGAVWTRALDGATPAVRLAAPPTNGTNTGSATILAGSSIGQFTLIHLSDPNKPAPTDTFEAVRSDGSGSPTVFWPVGSSTDTFTFLTNDDNNVVFATTNTGTGATTFHSFNLATSTDLPTAAQAGLTAPTPLLVSPDHNWVLGQGTVAAATHTFLLQVASTTVSPTSIGTPAANGVVAMPDSSGFVFQDSTGAEWFWGTTVVPTPNPVQLIAAASLTGGANFGPTVVGRAVAYTDKTATNQPLKVVSIPQAGALAPTTFTLEPNPTPAPMAIQTYTATDANGLPTSGELAWTLQQQPKAVAFNFPLTTAPTVGTLTALPSTCLNTQFAAGNAFLNGAFFYVCPDTSTISTWSPPFSATTLPALDTQLVTSVSGNSLITLGSSRVLYHRSDGTYFGANSDGSKTLLSKTLVPNQTGMVLSSWMMFFDPTSGLTRVSALNGSVIDEPLVDCNLTGAPTPLLLPKASPTEVLAPHVLCGSVLNPFVVTTANLP